MGGRRSGVPPLTLVHLLPSGKRMPGWPLNSSNLSAKGARVVWAPSRPGGQEASCGENKQTQTWFNQHAGACLPVSRPTLPPVFSVKSMVIVSTPSWSTDTLPLELHTSPSPGFWPLGQVFELAGRPSTPLTYASGGPLRPEASSFAPTTFTPDCWELRS